MTVPSCLSRKGFLRTSHFGLPHTKGFSAGAGPKRDVPIPIPILPPCTLHLAHSLLFTLLLTIVSNFRKLGFSVSESRRAHLDSKSTDTPHSCDEFPHHCCRRQNTSHSHQLTTPSANMNSFIDWSKTTKSKNYYGSGSFPTFMIIGR